MEKLIFYTLAGAAILIAIGLLIAGPAKGEEPDATAVIEHTNGVFPDRIKTYEFTPKTASAMQCIYVDGDFAGSVFCWPKIMNDQTLIDRLKPRP